MKEHVSAVSNVLSICTESCQGLYYLNYIILLCDYEWHLFMVKLKKQLILYSLAGQLLEQREWKSEASLMHVNIYRQCSLKKGFFLTKPKDLSM